MKAARQRRLFLFVDTKEAKRKFWAQRSGAAQRGIAWELTFEQWLEWWGDDLSRRGPGHDQLQMQRAGDVGPYALDNIRKGYPRDNSHTMSKNLRTRAGIRAAERLRERAEVVRWEPEDEMTELDEMRRELGYTSSNVFD